MKALILGGGAAGLSAALLLARRGHQVEVLERDPIGASGDAPRRGVSGLRPGLPQAGHSHAYVAAFRTLLTEHAPDVLAELLDAGAREIRLSDHPPPTLAEPAAADADLVVLGARRRVVDEVLRRIAVAEPGVRLRDGARVDGLVLDGEPRAAEPPTVKGLRLSGGATLAADVVIDAAGRRSPVPGWLATAGRPYPAEKSVPCGITYYSRFYSMLDPNVLPGPLNRGHTAGASFDRYSCLVFPADNDTFSVTFGVLPDDHDARLLRLGEAFDAVASRIELVGPWLDPTISEPLTGVAAMAGLTNRFRPWVDHGRPTVLGLLPIGDAALITNPAHTRGTTLGLSSAVRVAALIDEVADPTGRALDWDEQVRRDFLPWYHDSVVQDAHRLARWRPGAESPPELAEAPVTLVTNRDAYTAAQRDPVVWRAFSRLQNLLTTPDAVLDVPGIADRVREVLSTGWRPPAGAGPSHDELVEIASSAWPDEDAAPAPRPAPRPTARSAARSTRRR